MTHDRTTRHAHGIVVLRGGRIIETGSQAGLMAKQGHFYHLAALQTAIGTWET